VATDDDDPDRLTPMEERLFGLDRTPPDRELAELARPFVEEARLTYKLFRRDLENIESRVAAAGKERRLTPRQARDMWLDLGQVLSLPLIERYLAQGECSKVADWLRARLDLHETEWLNERNRIAIEGFIAQGEAALAVALLQRHLHKMMIATRDKWRYSAQAVKERAKGAPVPAARDIVAELPGELDLALLEIAECEVYIAAHGAKSDTDALAAMRDEIARARQRHEKSLGRPKDAN